MKLLLTSEGFSNKSIKKAFQKLLEKPITKVKLAFIPTAANVTTGDKSWLVNELIRFKEMGFAQIDIVDFTVIPRDIWLKQFKQSDVLYFIGGNTYHLMYSIKKTGLDKILPSLLKKRIYIGSSAGSIVMGEKLTTKAFAKYYSKEIPRFKGDNGMRFINFSIRPHFMRKDCLEYDDKNLKNMVKKFKTTIYALDDNTAIVVDGDKLEVVSEGKWEKFTSKSIN